MEGEEGGGGGVRRASTREDIRRKLANFGDEQEEHRKTTEELSLNNNLEEGGVPHEILFLGNFLHHLQQQAQSLATVLKESFVNLSLRFLIRSNVFCRV